MSLSDNQNLLNDPNIMIADTGATCDSISWHKEMINMKSSGAEDTITASNGEEMMPTKIGDLPVTQYEKWERRVKSGIAECYCHLPWVTQLIQCDKEDERRIGTVWVQHTSWYQKSKEEGGF